MGAFRPGHPRPVQCGRKKAMSRQDQNTFLYGSNATFIAELYSRFLEDPGSVDESWRSFFAELRGRRRRTCSTELRRPGLGPGAQPCDRQWPWRAGGVGQRPCRGRDGRRRGARDRARRRSMRCAPSSSSAPTACAAISGRSRPARPRAARPSIPSSIPRPTASPRPISTARSSSTTCSASSARRCARSSPRCARPIAARIGVEYMHIQELEQRQWIQARIEVPRNQTEFTAHGQARHPASA